MSAKDSERTAKYDDTTVGARGMKMSGAGIEVVGQAIAEFNLQVQQLNWFSLQWSEMFIATNANPKDSLL